MICLLVCVQPVKVHCAVLVTRSWVDAVVTAVSRPSVALLEVSKVSPLEHTSVRTIHATDGLTRLGPRWRCHRDRCSAHTRRKLRSINWVGKATIPHLSMANLQLSAPEEAARRKPRSCTRASSPRGLQRCGERGRVASKYDVHVKMHLQ